MPKFNCLVKNIEVDDILHKSSEIIRLSSSLDTAMLDLRSFVNDKYPADFELKKRINDLEKSKVDTQNTFKLLHYLLSYVFTVTKK